MEYINEFAPIKGCRKCTMIVRTFHSVGQGAFYTEKHMQGSSCVNIVYDCGSLSGNVDWDKVINTAFEAGEAIDLLFISHFHADHINGIKKLLNRCKLIKKVVIPFVDNEEKALLKFFNHVATSGKEDYGMLIDSPQKFFGEETEILQVLPVADNGQRQNTTGGLIKSGTEVDLLAKKWRFIPFNYAYGAKMAEFRKTLIEEGLDAKKLDTIDFLLKNKSKILRIYKKLNPHDINEDSLVLFSGTSVASVPDDLVFVRWLTSSRHFLHERDITSYEFNINCLYLGDANLNKIGYLDALKRCLCELYGTIGTIQIPHHGSKKSFSNHLLKSNPSKIISVITCGANRKKHPSKTVVDQITTSGSTLFVVTERFISKMTQIGVY